MVNILIIDVDSKHGNLYLRQLSAYHKSKGDRVHFWSYPEPNIVYVGCLFTKNGGNARGIRTHFPNSKVYVGGTGVNLNGGDSEIAKLKPDYDLYPNEDWALGRATWGCPNKCPWCVVPQKEGKFQRWIHPKEWYDDRFNTVWLLDNNILVDKEWFMEVTDWYLDMELNMKEGGMDFRFLDQEIAERLRELEFEGLLHFAWDSMNAERKVIEGINLLKEVGFNTKREISVYVLTRFNTTFKEDLYRVEKLREMNVNPFVMVYGDHSSGRSSLQWRVNRKRLFWTDNWKDGLKQY